MLAESCGDYPIRKCKSQNSAKIEVSVVRTETSASRKAYQSIELLLNHIIAGKECCLSAPIAIEAAPEDLVTASKKATKISLDIC